MGFAVAQQSFFLPALCAAGIGALLILRLQPWPLSTLLLGAALLGYIIGNRGFAQLYVASSLPLLPAELVLLVGGTILAVQSAFRRELPVRPDALNLALLVWIMIGSGRVLFDLRSYGVAALRDFATVYYASFFFLAQNLGKNARSWNFLYRCVLIGCAILPLTELLFEYFPGFFLTTLTARGNPLIYYKGDLVGIFLAVGAVLFFLRFEKRGRWWNLALSLALMAGMLRSNNRSSMVGLAVITVLLAVNGRWRFALVQAGTGLTVVLLILLGAHLTDTPMTKTPLYGLYERIESLADPFGQRAYSGEDTFYKGDNNRFRSIWWQTVVDETIEGNPWVGLGFGHDLADRFVREYYPNSGDEFSTRSPHNVLLTVFARMGVVGLIPFLIAVGLMVVRTVRSIRTGEQATALWCSAGIIFIAACFGVVLEGPMGAVVFWTLLGLAAAGAAPSPSPVIQTDEAKENAATTARPLPAAQPSFTMDRE